MSASKEDLGCKPHDKTSTPTKGQGSDMSSPAREVCERRKKAVYVRLDIFYEQMISLFQEIGVPEKDWDGRLNNSWRNVVSAMQEGVEEEKRRVRSLANSVDENGRRLLELASQLGQEVEEPDENLSLLQLDRVLLGKLQMLQAERDEIQMRMRVLREEEAALCTLLSMPPLQFSAPIPHKTDFQEVRAHIGMLTAEREKRAGVMSQLRQRLVAALESLEQSASSELEVEAVWSKEVRLGEQDLAVLEARVIELEAENTLNKVEADKLKKQLGQLWTRLEVPQNHRDRFLAANASHRPSTLDRIRKEVEAQEQLKRQNVERFVGKLRQEIAELWERCYFSLEQRQQFAPYYSDAFTEDILVQHEQELDRLKSYFETNRVLLKDVDEHERLWRKMLELEERATDRNRYMNRGGRLLLEEKERKKIARRLPKVQQDLQLLIEKWQVEHGSRFLVYGHDFAAYIEQQKQQREDQLEMQKEERATKKATQLEHETMFGARPTTPATQHRRLGASPTKQRRLESTRVGMCTSRLGAASPGPAGLARATRTPLALHNLAGSSRNTSMARTAPGKLTAREISSGTDMTYADFARGLQRLQATTTSPALRAATRSRRRSQRLAGLPPPAAPAPAIRTPGTTPRQAVRRVGAASRLVTPSPRRGNTPRAGGRVPIRNRALLGLPTLF